MELEEPGPLPEELRSAVMALAAQRKPALARPSQFTRFLLGLASPAAMRARLWGHPLYGTLADRSWAVSYTHLYRWRQWMRMTSLKLAEPSVELSFWNLGRLLSAGIRREVPWFDPHLHGAGYWLSLIHIYDGADGRAD